MTSATPINKKASASVSWFKYYARKFGRCERCHYGYNLTLHHRDGNKHNDNVKNFELLCSRKEYLFGLICLKGCHAKLEEEVIRKWRIKDQNVIQGTEKPISKIQILINAILTLLKN